MLMFIQNVFSNLSIVMWRQLNDDNNSIDSFNYTNINKDETQNLIQNNEQQIES